MPDSSVSVAFSTDQPTASVMAVIPAHNEASTVSGVVRGVVEHCGIPVVVVDDRSQDATARLAREAGATVLAPAIQLGAWGAMQAGIRYAVTQGCSCVVTLDADGQHEPASIPGLLEPVLQGNADVVIGACPQRASWMRKLAWALFKKMTGLRYEDLTSGFRVYNRRSIELLLTPRAVASEYQDMGILLLLESQNIRIMEVPLQMMPRRNDKSRIFGTWWHVLQYMVHSSIVCLAKRNMKKT